jgi:hypothetical protein
MLAQNFTLTRYDADEGKLFDWKEPRYIENENGEQIQEHLLVKTLFVGLNDTITNYVEVDDNGNITECDEPMIATDVDLLNALAELGVE